MTTKTRLKTENQIEKLKLKGLKEMGVSFLPPIGLI